MWTHYCKEEGCLLDVADGEECNWCGETQEDSQQQPKGEEKDGSAAV